MLLVSIGSPICIPFVLPWVKYDNTRAVFCCERNSRSSGLSQCLKHEHAVANDIINAISLVAFFRCKGIQSLIWDLTISSSACENTVDKARELVILVKLQVTDVVMLLLD